MPKKDLYFIAIIPDEPMRSLVQELKEQAAELWNSKSALKSPPHITLHMPFQWRDDREDRLLEALEKFDHATDSFEIKLSSFDFFEPRVVYVDVVESAMLRELQKRLTAHIRKELNILNADYKDRGFHPHMTIAFRDLKKSIFPEVMNYYQSQAFEGEFNYKGFTLLKHDGKRWQEFKRLSYRSL